MELSFGKVLLNLLLVEKTDGCFVGKLDGLIFLVNHDKTFVYLVDEGEVFECKFAHLSADCCNVG